MSRDKLFLYYFNGDAGWEKSVKRERESVCVSSFALIFSLFFPPTFCWLDVCFQLQM